MSGVQEVSWGLVREQLQHINPKLVQVIDSIDPAKRHSFINVDYPFGADIMRHGEFCFDHIPPAERSLLNKLNYQHFSTPIMLALDKQLELYVPTDNRIIPYLIVKPGDIFGLWQLLDEQMPEGQSYMPYSIWNMTSGARSLFMLPKISEKGRFEKLQRQFKLPHDKPQRLQEHWRTFKGLYDSPEFTESWYSRVVFFSKEWFDDIHDPAFHELKLFMYQHMWRQSTLWRSQIFWELTLSRIHMKRELTPCHYFTDVAKHLLAIGTGVLPGFVPADNDDLAPVAQLQGIYRDVYGLDEWAPVIMQPQMFDMQQPQQSVYYSLQYPSSILHSIKSKTRSSVLGDTFGIAMLLDKYCRELRDGNYHVDKTPLKSLAEKVGYEYFHTDESDYNIVRVNTDLIDIDPRFNLGDQFPKNSVFFRGCVRIYRE